MQRFTCMSIRSDLASLVFMLNRHILPTKKESFWLPWWPQQARPHTICVTSRGRAWDQCYLRRSAAAGFYGRLYSKDSKKDPKHPGIRVVGTPDLILWMRNKFMLFLIQLYFGLTFNEEFEIGVKQAVVLISTMISRGQFEKLSTVMTREGIESVRERCKGLSDTQKRHLAISQESIIFVLPEDISVFFNETGRTFMYITMRLWFVSCADVPEDPNSSQIFRSDFSEEEDGDQRKIITAVYEFNRELTTGMDPEWTVTRVWHWKQLE